MLSVLIRNGLLVDGSGSAATRADVGIVGDKVVAVGQLGSIEAERVIDASGMVVSPGFIDIHTHSEIALLIDPRGLSKISQGVTTEVVNNCGLGPFPLTPEKRGLLVAQYSPLGEEVDWDWTDLTGYSAALERRGIGVNVASLLGHSAVRGAVVGFGERTPTTDEVKQMQRLVTEAMEQGAFGLSVGLSLPPSAYADTEELVALAQAMAPFPGRFYSSHSRGWAEHLGIPEAVEVGRRAGVPVEVSHIGINDPRQWGDAELLLGILEQGRSDGVDVTCDTYPYLASGSGFSQFTPTWAQSGGRKALAQRIRDPKIREEMKSEMAKGPFRGRPWLWDRIIISQVDAEEAKPYEGMTLQQAAETMDLDPLEASLRLMDMDDARMDVVFFYRNEDDVRTFLRSPLCMLGSDGTAISPGGKIGAGKPHPRFYGAQTRLLGRYVREEGVLSLEQAVYKMSGQVADRLSLGNRGRLAPGQAADVVVFDPETVVDRADFQNPHQFAEGVNQVFVNGELAVKDGVHTGALAGRVLKAC